MIDKWISLRWERGTRYYEVYLHQDLWGDWVLTQVWGRGGMELGRIAPGSRSMSGEIIPLGHQHDAVGVEALVL
jgi:hypothetical protein